MFSSKPNTVIKFYTQPKSSSTHSRPQSLVKLLLNDSKYAKKYPDFFVQHQKYILEDFKKKTEEIKNLKQRFPYTQRIIGASQNKSSLLCDRSSLSPKRAQRKYNKFKTQLSIGQSQPINKSCVNTITLQCFVDGPPIGTNNQKNAKRLSQFQKNAIKRMKTRQDMILKKKCESLFHDSQRNILVAPSNLCLNTMTAKEKAQPQFYFD